MTRIEDVSRSGVLFQSDYIASWSTPIDIRLILPVPSARSNSYAEALSMPITPPERLDALGNLTSTVSLFRFLRS